MPVCTITRNLVGCSSDGVLVEIGEGNSYQETITVNTGYKMEGASINIIMGGADITSQYDDGVLNITEVTGDIVINITAVKLQTYSIQRSLSHCTSDSVLSEILEGEQYIEEFTPDTLYYIDMANSSITMGGDNITSSLVNNTLTIPNVTGDIVITINCIEYTGVQPIVALDLSNVGTDGVISNLGTGGDVYNAQIQKTKSGDTFASTEAGLSLVNHAFANVPYGFNASTPFTIIVKGRIKTKSTNTYQRMFRTSSDAPSLFYSKNSTALGSKLAGVSGSMSQWTIHDALGNNSNVQAMNTCYLSYQNEDGFDESVSRNYMYVSDGKIIEWYIDGVLIASQSSNQLTSSTYIGIGDNDTSKTYYATEIEISRFEIYDQALESDPLQANV